MGAGASLVGATDAPQLVQKLESEANAIPHRSQKIGVLMLSNSQVAPSS